MTLLRLTDGGDQVAAGSSATVSACMIFNSVSAGEYGTATEPPLHKLFLVSPNSGHLQPYRESQ